MEKALDFSKLQSAIGLRSELDSLGGVVNVFVPYLFGIAGILLLLYLIWGGFGLMLSRGDPKAVEGAKSKITNAVIGFVIIFVAFWLVQILGQIFGIEQFKNIFGLVSNAYAVSIEDIYKPPLKDIPQIGQLVSNVIATAQVLGGLLMFIFLIFGGVSMIMGAGADDPQKTAQGKKAITMAIVGFLIIFASYWIIQIIEKIIGFSILNK